MNMTIWNNIDGIEYDEKESTEELKLKIDNALVSIGVEKRSDMYSRFHRSSKPYTKNGKRYAQTIVRFRYWSPRLQAQKGKKVARDKKLIFQVRNDLTRRRYNLMRVAVANLPKRKDTFTFADANSNLAIRDGDDVFYYNTEKELDDILRQL